MSEACVARVLLEGFFGSEGLSPSLFLVCGGGGAEVKGEGHEPLSARLGLIMHASSAAGYERRSWNGDLGEDDGSSDERMETRRLSTVYERFRDTYMWLDDPVKHAVSLENESFVN